MCKPIYMCIGTHMYTQDCICMYAYVYIYIYVYIHTLNIFLSIFMYMCVGRERERERESARQIGSESTGSRGSVAVPRIQVGAQREASRGSRTPLYVPGHATWLLKGPSAQI